MNLTEQQIAKVAARSGAKSALVVMGETLKMLPAGKFAGFGFEAGQGGEKVLTIRWNYLDRHGLMRRSYFDFNTGEYLGDYA
jgi:hypothetical protein